MNFNKPESHIHAQAAKTLPSFARKAFASRADKAPIVFANRRSSSVKSFRRTWRGTFSPAAAVSLMDANHVFA